MPPPAVTALPSFHAVFHSADHVHLIATHLRVNDLLTVSTLCRSLHPLFDSDAVWQDKLREAERIQDMQRDQPSDGARTEDALTAAQVAALPPLPSLSEVAALCLQAYNESQAQLLRRRLGAIPPFVRPPFVRPPYHLARLTAIVHLPSTLLYHARILNERWRAEPSAPHLEFELTFSEQQQQWTASRSVEQGGEWNPFSGWRAIDIDDNVGLNEHESGYQSSHSTTASARTNTISGKQRYIDLLSCSEHVHNECYRLLPPSVPRPVKAEREQFVHLPPLSPLPLCTSCRTAITRCMHRAHVNRQTTSFGNVVSVRRITATMYETTMDNARDGFYVFRHFIQYQHATGEQDDEVDGYTLVGDYGGIDLYESEQNVCEQCQYGITASGKGHSDWCAAREANGGVISASG